MAGSVAKLVNPRLSKTLPVLPNVGKEQEPFRLRKLSGPEGSEAEIYDDSSLERRTNRPADPHTGKLPL